MLTSRKKHDDEGPVVTKDGNPYNYIVVIDAGSSGSRVYIYHYPSLPEDSDNAFDDEKHEKKTRPFPHVSQEGKKWRKKIHPGIADISKDEKKIQKHIKELMGFAEKIVPKIQQPRTPVFLHATGGVRKLASSDQHHLLNTACQWTQDHTDFYIPDCESHFTTITGQIEGIFGWLGVNYLIGGLDDPSSHDHGKDHYTYGFMDMGGASTQIAFVPNSTEISRHKPDLYRVQLAAFNSEQNQILDVYSESFQGLGVNEARRSYFKTTNLNKTESDEFEDPCTPKGLKHSIDKRGEEYERKADDDDKHEDKDEYKFIGTGDYDLCNSLLDPLLEDIKKAKTPNFDLEIDHFVGVSEYWDATEGFELGGDMEFGTLSEKVKQFCNTPWNEIQEKKEKEFPDLKMHDLKDLCFKSSWLLNVVNEGYNFPESRSNSSNHSELGDYMKPLQSVEKINGVEYSWTLGRAFVYATSELGPDGKDAGIQKNSAATKWDYGREPRPWIRPNFKGKVTNDDRNKTWDELFDQNSHRLWGSIVFLTILGVIVYLLLGKKRRNVIWESFKARLHDKFPLAETYVKLGNTDDASEFELNDIPEEFEIGEEEETV